MNTVSEGGSGGGEEEEDRLVWFGAHLRLSNRKRYTTSVVGWPCYQKEVASCKRLEQPETEGHRPRVSTDMHRSLSLPYIMMIDWKLCVQTFLGLPAPVKVNWVGKRQVAHLSSRSERAGRLRIALFWEGVGSIAPRLGWTVELFQLRGCTLNSCRHSSDWASPFLIQVSLPYQWTNLDWSKNVRSNLNSQNICTVQHLGWPNSSYVDQNVMSACTSCHFHWSSLEDNKFGWDCNWAENCRVRIWRCWPKEEMQRRKRPC